MSGEIYIINKSNNGYGIDAQFVADSLTIHVEGYFDGGFSCGRIRIDLRKLLKELNLKIVEETDNSEW